MENTDQTKEQTPEQNNLFSLDLPKFEDLGDLI
jgi:hypothetical protein